MKIMKHTALLLAAIASGVAFGAEPATEPRPVPLTRPEMKQFLEDMKKREPRIPLPELTDADRERIGERGMNYESRLRYHYINGGSNSGGGGGRGGAPGGAGGGGAGGAAGGGAFGGFGFSRENDPKMTLTYAFKTELFWIVARTNNCQYCLGHQESKLLGAGLSEDEIAALDGNWLEFKPAEQAAFRFARKVTYQPHLISDADVADLKKHYTDLQILEMTLSTAGNNAINRWKEGAGIPQSSNGGGFGNRRPGDGAAAGNEPRSEAHQSYLTDTAEKNRKTITSVAPYLFDAKKGEPTRASNVSRPSVEPRADVEKALAQAAQRTPRLPLVEEAAARELLPEDWSKDPLPQWVRLLANFPRDGKSRILSRQSADTTGDLKPLLKAQVSWIIARQDRAWYAAGLAKQRLNKLGVSDDKVFALDGDWSEFTPAERAQFTLARKLSVSPIVLTDADVAVAVKEVGPRDTTQLIQYVTTCASFDRITEVAGLRVEK